MLTRCLSAICASTASNSWKSDICVLTAFHVAKSEEKLAEMQQAVGSYVTSECNIFALSVKDPNDLPADIRDDMMRFRDAYRIQMLRSKRAISISTQATCMSSNRSMRRWSMRRS